LRTNRRLSDTSVTEAPGQVDIRLQNLDQSACLTIGSFADPIRKIDDPLRGGETPRSGTILTQNPHVAALSKLPLAQNPFF
jgi:hypothetical protein